MSHQRQPYANGQRSQYRPNQIDMHEKQKQEIYKQSDNDGGFRFGFNNPPQPTSGTQVALTSPPDKIVGFEDVELYFDSTQRDTSSDLTVGEIKWDVTIINNSKDIKNCVEMHIGEFYFPKIYAPVGTPEFFYFGRVFIEFQNASSTQATLGSNNNKFHFEFKIENITAQAVKLVPVKPTFYFQRPMTSITDFQLRFMVPPVTSQSSIFKRIPIPIDTVQVTSLVTLGIGYNPIRFQINGGYDTTILGPVGAIVSPGIASFISGYISNSQAVNTLVNNTNGIYITNIVDSTTFEVAGIDSTSVNAEFPATVYIPKNRIAFSVRFTTVKDHLTNYIGVVHT